MAERRWGQEGESVGASECDYEIPFLVRGAAHVTGTSVAAAQQTTAAFLADALRDAKAKYGVQFDLVDGVQDDSASVDFAASRLEYFFPRSLKERAHTAATIAVGAYLDHQASLVTPEGNADV